MKTKFMLVLFVCALLSLFPVKTFGDTVATSPSINNISCAANATNCVAPIGVWSDEGWNGKGIYLLRKCGDIGVQETKQVCEDPAEPGGEPVCHNETTTIVTGYSFCHKYTELAYPTQPTDMTKVTTGLPKNYTFTPSDYRLTTSSAPQYDSVVPDMVITEWSGTGHLHFKSEFKDQF